MRILDDMLRQFQIAIIVVTHDEKIVPTFRRTHHMRGGVTHEDAGKGRALSPGTLWPAIAVAESG